MTYWTVKLEVASFDTREEAEVFQEALIDAFTEIPKANSIDAFADIKEHRIIAAGVRMPKEAAREEALCSCGAGHGSLEGHMDWCDYTAPQPNADEREAMAEIINDALHEYTERHMWEPTGSPEAIADALIAAGWTRKGWTHKREDE